MIWGEEDSLRSWKHSVSLWGGVTGGSSPIKIHQAVHFYCAHLIIYN